jgi:hypothetical protein
LRGRAVCIALAALLAPSLAALSVRGMVVDSSGAPVPFAIVALADSSRAVLTDTKGLSRLRTRLGACPTVARSFKNLSCDMACTVVRALLDDRFR